MPIIGSQELIGRGRTLNVFVTESLEDFPEHQLVGICSVCVHSFGESDLKVLLKAFRLHTCLRIVHSTPVPMVFGSTSMMPR